MKMKMYLYPGYVSLASARAYSPRLFEFLENMVELEAVRWNGSLTSLPTDEPIMVRASSRLPCSLEDLALRCEELGHFVYYDDQLLLTDGSYTREGLIESAQRFLERVQSH